MSFIPPNYVRHIFENYPNTYAMIYNDNTRNIIYEFIEKILNLNDRIDLPENLQNKLIEIDNKHLPEIARSYRFSNNAYYKKFLDAYKFDQDQVYDKLFIEKAKIKIEEQDEKISSLKDEIDEMKKIIETLKTNLLNFNYQYY